jgi:hypothetical protein
MANHGCDFPFRSRGSLAGLAAFWTAEARNPDSAHAEVARRIVDRIEARAGLASGTLDSTPGALDSTPVAEDADLVEAMFEGLLPPAERDRAILVGVVPYGSAELLYESREASRLGLAQSMGDSLCLNVTQDMWEVGSTVSAYNLVISRLYGVEPDFDYPIVVTLEDPETGLARHLRLRWDTRFVEVAARDDVRSVTEAELDRVLAEPMNIALWMEVLPPEAFEFRGLTLIHAVDVTADHALSLLKNDLLAKGAMSSPERVDHLQYRIRTLMRRNDLRLGLIAVERGDGVEGIISARPLGRSLLLGSADAPDCPHKKDSVYAKAVETREPVVVHDLEAAEVRTGFERHLLSQGIRNLLIWPLFENGEFVGLVELGSPTPGAINAFNSLKLAEVQGLFATAIERFANEREDRIQAVIKQQYTAIHPAVEWKFREAALRYVQDEEGGETPTVEPVVFPGVYPLYGLSDIRGSSETRNAAIQGDLLEQLRLAEEVVCSAFRLDPLPILDQLSFRVGQFIERVEDSLRSEDETAVLEFLRGEVEPLFERLRVLGPSVAEATDRYYADIDPSLGVLYRRRKDFEESVARINQTIDSVLEEEQGRAQAMHPHYCEKFKTDGVEHTVYIGESISRGGGFHPMHLGNLRLWQLLLMVRVERALREERDSLPVHLETTHLVLVQDHPLAIRFRPDEKQFDVDGAYNIRYEIAKKRIDKAVIRGSRERLTRPGTLSVVYSQTREAAEYRKYLAFLEDRGLVEGPVEEFELEDLQGLHGLKAFRATIADGASSEAGWREDGEVVQFPDRNGPRTPAASA